MKVVTCRSDIRKALDLGAPSRDGANDRISRLEQRDLDDRSVDEAKLGMETPARNDLDRREVASESGIEERRQTESGVRDQQPIAG